MFLKLKKLSFSVILIISTIFFVQCRYDYSRVDTSERDKKANESMLKVNKFLVQKDVELIESYFQRRNWDMKKTKTGLFYEIVKDSTGKLAQKDQLISLKYSLELLDGTECYTSDSLGLKEFKIGKGGVEEGLEQAVLMLSVGDKARFIFPPHLGHGLIGDQNRIPARASLVYQVEVVNIK